jgi:hypothetical protein
MATVTQSEFDAAFGRRSQEDHKRIMDALKADGSLTVEADEAPPPEEPLVDDEGNPVLDSEGNPVMQAPQPFHSDALVIERDNEEIIEEGKIPEDYLIAVAPGTQNVAQPFPEEEGSKRSGGRRSRRSTKKDEVES